MKKFLSAMLFLGFIGTALFPGVVGAEVSDPTIIRALQEQVASLMQRVSELQTQLQRINGSAVSPVYQSTIDPYVSDNPTPISFSCGDTNMDGKINNDDATVITNYIFSGGTLPAGIVMSDADGNGRIDISDSVYLINYVNSNGAAPKCNLGVNSAQTIGVSSPVVAIIPPNTQSAIDHQPTDSFSSNKFQIGWRVQAQDFLNVRVIPGGSSLGTQARGVQGVIVDGPQSASGYVWYKVDYDNSSIDGWSVQDWMEVPGLSSIQLSGNQAPRLTDDSFISPTSVGISRSNWWRLQAVDPEGKMMTYVVEWGDGKTDTYTGQSGQAKQAFHQFTTPGTYTLRVRASDPDGGVVYKTMTTQAVAETSLTPSTKFSVGDDVEATDYLNVRNSPSGVVQATLPAGSKGRVVGGPVWGIMGDWWWNINYTNNVSGWSAETWIKKSTASAERPYFTCADVNSDGVVNLADANKIQDYIFNGGTLPSGRGDVDGSGTITISDSVYLINYVSAGGANPKCGVSPITNTLPVEPVQKINPQPVLPVTPVPQENVMSCGDLNLDGRVTNDDANVITNYIFNGGTLPSGRGDVDGSGVVNISDATAIVNYINKGTALKCSVVTTPTQSQFSCGDTNMDGKINNDDATVITNYIFSGGTLPAGIVMSDADGNGRIDISDSVYLINYVNSNGAAPKCPIQNQSTQASAAAASVIGTTGSQLDSILSRFQNLMRSLR